LTRLLLLLFICFPIYAAELTPKQAYDIFIVAYGQYTGSPEWLKNPPPVNITSQEDLCKLVHDDKPTCVVRGLYHNHEVYVLDTLDFSTVIATAILLHEYIHYFQELKLGPVQNCGDNLDREMEAYHIQYNVLKASGEWWEARRVHATAMKEKIIRRCE